MKNFFVIFSFGFFFPFHLLFFPIEVRADTPDQLIKKLDRQYYYPQHHGLNKLAVRIRWEQLDVLTGTQQYLAKPDLMFSWDSSSKRRFDISNDVQVSSGKRRNLLNVLENYQELVIPLTLKERFERFNGTLKKKRKDRVQVDFQSMNPEDPVRLFRLLIDAGRWVISKLQIYQNHEPKKIRVTLNYIPKGDQWLLFESSSQFKMDKSPFVETTRYFYERVQTFWLVRKVEQTVKRNDEIIQGYVFRMDRYRLN